MTGRLILFVALVLSIMLHAVPLRTQVFDGAPGEWVESRRGKVVVFHEPQDAPAAELLHDLLETRLDDFAFKLGAKEPDQIRIVIAPSQARFRYLTRGLPEWTGGVAYPRQKLIILQTPKQYQGRGQFVVTALHEVVHILTDHDSPSRLPRWLSEGLAMYLSGETMYKQRTPLGRAVVFGQTHTLEGIEGMLRLGPEQARVAYLQSISFVDFLVERYGWETMSGLIQGYRQGSDPDSLFIGITGHDLFDVEAAWHREMRDKYRWFALLSWVNFDTILWGGATFLVVFGGGLAIYRRRSYLKDKSDEAIPLDGGEKQDPVTGEWYVDDDYWQ